MPRGVLSLSFGLAVLATLSLAPAGCDRLDDFFDGIHGGGGGGPTAQPCTSTADCPSGTSCTTEAGVCNPPPGCDPAKGVCAAVCYGTCARPSNAAACRTDADCRLFSDYCTGCDCRALATGAPDPTCPGPGVQCLVDPCEGKSAVCKRGACAVAGP